MAANGRGAAGEFADGRLPLSVHSVAASFPAFYRFLGNALWVPTHYYERRTCPCPGEDQCGLHQLSLQWKGYAPGLLWINQYQRWEAFVVELTENAWFGLKSHDLRGWVVELQRSGKGNRSRVEVTFQDKPDFKDLVPAFSVVATLANMWRVKSFKHFAKPEKEARDARPIISTQPPPPAKPQRVGRVEALSPEQREANRAKMRASIPGMTFSAEAGGSAAENGNGGPSQGPVPQIQPPAPTRNGHANGNGKKKP